MTPATPFTPEVALAIAADYIKRNAYWTPPVGYPVDAFITGKSPVVVFDLAKLDNANVFGMAVVDVVTDIKANLRNELTASRWGDSHKEVGFQFIVYPCDSSGHRAIDLSSNTFTSATGVAMQARMFAKDVR